MDSLSVLINEVPRNFWHVSHMREARVLGHTMRKLLVREHQVYLVLFLLQASLQGGSRSRQRRYTSSDRRAIRSDASYAIAAWLALRQSHVSLTHSNYSTLLFSRRTLPERREDTRRRVTRDRRATRRRDAREHVAKRARRGTTRVPVLCTRSLRCISITDPSDPLLVYGF